MEEKEHKTISERLKKGSIMIAYRAKYFINVMPAPGIDKVKISIVKIGTEGKVHNDFYLETYQFYDLCREIDNGKAARKIAEDKEVDEHPTAYQFTSGENGSKRLYIGKANTGIKVCVNVNNNGWRNMMSIMSISEFKEMSFYYQLVMGLIPVQPGSYYDGLIKLFQKGVENIDQKHKNNQNYNSEKTYYNQSSQKGNSTDDQRWEQIMQMGTQAG